MVTGHTNAGVTGSNSVQNMDVCARFLFLPATTQQFITGMWSSRPLLGAKLYIWQIGQTFLKFSL
jgi:hypothetical protein